MATSISVDWDPREVTELALDLDHVGPRATRRLVTVGEEWSEDLEEQWRDNAVLTARSHGKHYPSRIDHERLGYLLWEIGPHGHPQGEMSFEYGSRNQPPHLDGGRALDMLLPFIERRVAVVAEEVF